MSQDQKPNRMRVVAGGRTAVDRRIPSDRRTGRVTDGAEPGATASGGADSAPTLLRAGSFLVACVAGGALVGWLW